MFRLSLLFINYFWPRSVTDEEWICKIKHKLHFKIKQVFLLKIWSKNQKLNETINQIIILVKKTYRLNNCSLLSVKLADYWDIPIEFHLMDLKIKRYKSIFSCEQMVILFLSRNEMICDIYIILTIWLF